MRLKIYCLALCLALASCATNSSMRQNSVEPHQWALLDEEIANFRQRTHYTIVDSVGASEISQIEKGLELYRSRPAQLHLDALAPPVRLQDPSGKTKYLIALTNELLRFNYHDGKTIELLAGTLASLERAAPDISTAISGSLEYVHFLFNLPPDLEKKFLLVLDEVVNRHEPIRKRFERIEDLALAAHSNPQLNEKALFIPALLSSNELRCGQIRFLNFWDNYLYCEGMHPSLDPSRLWNWKDRTWFIDRSLPFPYLNGNNTGVDLTSDPCSPVDGWRLFIRRLVSNDGEPTTHNSTVTLRPEQKYFTLYNEYTGILRTFIYISGPNQNSGDMYRVVAEISQGGQGNPYPGHGFFNIAGSLAWSNQELGQLLTNQVEYFCEYLSPGWVVIDLPLTYFRIRGSEPYFLNYTVQSTDRASIQLAGSFELEQSDYLPSHSTFFSSFSNILGQTKNIGSIKKDISGIGTDLMNTGQSMQQGHNADFGLSLIRLGDAFLNGASPVSAVIGGSQMIASLLDFGGPELRYTYHKGTLELGGSITNTADEGFVSMLIQPNFMVDVGEVPFLFKSDPFMTLGLFNFKNLPTVEILHDLYGSQTSVGLSSREALGFRVASDMQVALNGHENVQILSCEVQPVVRRPKYYENMHGCGDGFSSHGPNILRCDAADDRDNSEEIFPPTFLPASQFHFLEMYHCFQNYGNTAEEKNANRATAAHLRARLKLGVTKKDGSIKEIDLYLTFVDKYDYVNFDWVQMHYWE